MGIYGYMDIYWILQISSKFRRNFVKCPETSFKFRRNFVKMSGFRVPPALCVCVAAACGASATSEKTRPWNSGVCILCILSIFVDFRVHQVVNSSTTLHLYAYLCVLAPPWSYSISEIHNPGDGCFVLGELLL